MKGAICPDCGNPPERPGIVLVAPFDARGPNGDPCDNAFHAPAAFRPVTGLRRFREGWAQTWKLGRHWRLEVEWIPKGRSFDFWIYDARVNRV